MSDQNNLLLNYQKILNCISHLPKQILSLHSLDNVQQFVLHGICNKNCFNIPKAAYFIDNPDFDFIQGIAGFNNLEYYPHDHDIWLNPDTFCEFIKNSDFNNKIKNFNEPSVKKNDSLNKTVEKISHDIGFNKPSFCCWQMKHDNHGLLIYEKEDNVMDLFNDHFLNSLHLLSFCHIG